MHLSLDGWIVEARHCPSPNYNERPAGTPVNLLVLHNISLPPGEFGGGHIESFFQNRLDPEQDPYFETICDLQVSAHLLIDRQGSLIQFVSLYDRAWHAGQSVWCGQENCNDYSIGIELEGTDTVPFEQVQYEALGQVTEHLLHWFPEMARNRIVGHSDIAPGRKTDPGPCFDWQQFSDSLA